MCKTGERAPTCSFSISYELDGSGRQLEINVSAFDDIEGALDGQEKEIKTVDGLKLARRQRLIQTLPPVCPRVIAPAHPVD